MRIVVAMLVALTLAGIRVSVSYTWQGPEPLMGNRGLVGGTVASMSCQ
jgi:hypothetical protein